MLKKRGTPFVVALNKIDRMYGWVPQKNAPFQKTFDSQEQYCKDEFEQRMKLVVAQFAEQSKWNAGALMCSQLMSTAWALPPRCTELIRSCPILMSS